MFIGVVATLRFGKRGFRGEGWADLAGARAAKVVAKVSGVARVVLQFLGGVALPVRSRRLPRWLWPGRALIGVGYADGGAALPARYRGNWTPVQ